MHPTVLLGLLGVLAIEASYIPQILRLHRLKRADDVSYLFPSLNVAGRICALSYALIRGEPVFVTSFTIGIALRGTFLAQVVWYRALRRRVTAAAALGVSDPHPDVTG